MLCESDINGKNENEIRVFVNEGVCIKRRNELEALSQPYYNYNTKNIESSKCVKYYYKTLDV